MIYEMQLILQWTHEYMSNSIAIIKLQGDEKCIFNASIHLDADENATIYAPY